MSKAMFRHNQVDTSGDGSPKLTDQVKKVCGVLNGSHDFAETAVPLNSWMEMKKNWWIVIQVLFLSEKRIRKPNTRLQVWRMKSNSFEMWWSNQVKKVSVVQTDETESKQKRR